MEKYLVNFSIFLTASLFMIQVLAIPPPTENYTNDSKIPFAISYFGNKSTENDIRKLGYQTQSTFQEFKFIAYLEESYMISLGQYYELSCGIATSLNISNIYWLRGDDIESTINNLRKNKNSSFPPATNDEKAILIIKSKYVINCASKADVGNYSCICISNDNHVYRSSSYIYIASNVTKDCALHSSPVITEYISSLLSVVGSDVVLHCTTTANSTITWSRAYEKENNPIDLFGNQRYEIHDGSFLRINSIRREDMGYFICTAKTEYGEDYAETFLYPLNKK